MGDKPKTIQEWRRQMEGYILATNDHIKVLTKTNKPYNLYGLFVCRDCYKEALDLASDIEPKELK